MIEKDPSIDALLRAALREDIGPRDLSGALIPKDRTGKGDCLFREEGILCGIEIAEKLFRMIDGEIRFLPAAKDGEFIEKDRVIFYLEGPCRSILAAERTVLNFLGRLSGVATLTRRFVDAVQGTSAVIYDTRKTMPLLRKLDRYAVRTGGGQNHRTGLFDGVLIKDNHLQVMKGLSFQSIYQEVRRRTPKNIPIGIEVKAPGDVEAAIPCGFDVLLLDNFTVEEVQEAVAIRKRMVSNQTFEVSGNIRLENVRDYALTGVERISIGALTHSAKALDVTVNLI